MEKDPTAHVPVQIHPAVPLHPEKPTIAAHAESLKDILLVHGLETCGEFPSQGVKRFPAFSRALRRH